MTTPRFKVGDRVVMNKKAPLVLYQLTGRVNAWAQHSATHDYFVEFDPQYKLPGSWILEEYLDPEGVTADPAQSDTPKSEYPSCSFCGEAGKGAQVIDTGLRCQAESWHVCYRGSCNETIPYHRERIEAGLVDCEETRAATWRWTKERLGIKC